MIHPTQEEIHHLLPAGITAVHSESIALGEPFVDVVRRFAHQEGTVALMSGGDLDCARYHVLGVQPRLLLSARGGAVRIDIDGEPRTVTADPFDMLDQVVRRYRVPKTEEAAPIRTGLLGYLAYDLKDHLEILPKTSIDDLGLPSLYMTLPSLLLVHDRSENRSSVHVPLFAGEDPGALGQRLDAFRTRLSGPPPGIEADPGGQGSLASPFSRRAYMDAVEIIRDYIVDGHVYQVNMSQRFQSRFTGEPFEHFRHMYLENPAPFFAYINAGDHQIVSTSPERFIRLDGNQVETRPIKGTRPRGQTPEEDAANRLELEKSAKDDAELSMIVDLLRNDIGKVCRAGSVAVTQHKRLEAYKNVYHLVSIVNGILDEDKNSIDLIRATFPGGSITGCPKIRSMEIIDELEPVRRHIYTGSIGYISFHETMDLSIAIRTATVRGGHIYFSVGGGIVYDSNPADEYDETLHKGRTLMRSIERGTGAGAAQGSRASAGRGDSLVWRNGIFEPCTKAVISCEDEGFLFGLGIFETVRVEAGRPLRLDDHLARFHRAFREVFETPPPDVSFADIIAHLCRANGLERETAACKILAAAGRPGRSGPGTILVTVRPYRHRLEGRTDGGLRLAVYPHPRESFLADHKTMNYLFYKLAGRYALRQEADEALILNPDHTVSETNTANLFCGIEGRICCPTSRHALPGTMAAAVRKRLAAAGLEVTERPLTVADLQQAEMVFATNALMGAVPVIAVDGAPIESAPALCRELNKALFGRVPWSDRL